MGWLEGSVALVTGGGSGIGRAVVARFVEEGARVGVLERVPARAAQLRADFGEAVVASAGDVTSGEDNARAVADTVQAFGRLDVFVGNAGVFDNFLSFAELPAERLSQAFDELFAVKLGPGVRVNGVAPGGTITDLRGLAALGQDQKTHWTAPDAEDRLRAGNPLELALQPSDLAGAYVLLASRTSARAITGQIITVDAGAGLRRSRLAR